MAELRSSTSIGGNLAWHTGNLRFDTQGNTIRYAGFKLYSENDKPTTTELNVYSKQESDTKYALVAGANYVSKTLNETMAGSLTVNGNELAVTGFAPRVSLTETDTGKTWWTVADGNDFSIRESTLGNIVFNISAGGTGVNFNANSFKLNAKEAINGADSWLRLNGGGAFTSGIFVPGLIRVDGTIQTGDTTGTGLYVNTSAFSWKGTEVFTANNYTTLDARFVNATGDTMTGSLGFAQDKHIEFAPNSSYGAKLRVGGNGRTASNDGLTASVTTTNGNVHIDGASGSRGVYLNYYAGTDGVKFGNGAGANVGTVDAAGNMVMNGTITAPTVNTKTIQGQGSSIGWGSLDVTGIKGGYAGFNFTDAGHWFGVQPNGLSGVWNSAGTSKWYFNATGVLTGGATVPWNIVTDTPDRVDWATKSAINLVAGQLAWRNFGNNHTIFDASAGLSPSGTSVDKNNAQIAWKAADAAYPTLMGWNGQNTYGVRVDSARVADSATSALPLAGGVMTGEITINTNSIRGAYGAAIIKDHGNGNTTFSGSRNAASTVGDLYLGYHDNTNYFTNKVILHQSMYAGGNTSLQIIDSSNGALFDKGAAVIGANRGNVLGNSSFGVGFLTTADSGAQWIAGYFGKNGGVNQVVVGELSGGAVIGAHNAAKTAWADLYIGTHPPSGGNNITHISMPYARMSGNTTSYEILHRGNFNPDSKLSENGHYGGTLKLNNWFRSVGDSGWYNETYNGGIWMDESTTVKVYNGKKFYVANTSSNSISTTGGVQADVSMTAPVFNGALNGNASTASDATRANSLNTQDANPNGRLASGSYQNSVASTANGWPVSTGTWMHLLTSTHSNDSNYFSMQFAASFYTNSQLYYRSTNGNGGTDWAKIWTSAVFDPDTKANLSGATFTGNVTAPTFNGLALDPFTTASTVVVRDASGDIRCRILRPEIADVTYMDGAIAFRSTASTSGNYLNFCNSPTAVRSWLGAASTTVATAYDTGLMSSNDKVKLNNIAADKSPTETVLWSGLTTAHPTNNQIPLQFSVAGYNKLRFEFVNSGDTIGMVHTLSVSDWAAMTGTGRLIHIAVGSYSYTFGAAAYSATVLYRNTSSNCYLIRIVGLK